MTSKLTPEQIRARLVLRAEDGLEAEAGLRELGLFVALMAPFMGTSIGLSQLEESIDEAYQAQEQQLGMGNDMRKHDDKHRDTAKFERYLELSAWMAEQGHIAEQIRDEANAGGGDGEYEMDEYVNKVMTGPDAQKVNEFWDLQKKLFPEGKKMEHDSSNSTHQPLKDSLDYGGVEDASKYPHAAAQLSALIAKRTPSKAVRAEWAAARTAASSWEGEAELEIGEDFYTVDYTVEYEASAAEAPSWGYSGGDPGHDAGVEFWEPRVLKATKAVAGADGNITHEDVVDGDELAVLSAALEEKFDKDDHFREGVERDVLEGLGPDDDYPEREEREPRFPDGEDR